MRQAFTPAHSTFNDLDITTFEKLSLTALKGLSSCTCFESASIFRAD
ncbi:hypothetical protein KUI_0143 [Taylorella equigenitalis ATCC 35865]|uniref:Uncharacterized protein n=1 Tax=Taylorella equigenitalis ATCC 35865 TaxID=743973 RepID=A0ABN4AU65_9BURK|nr:hypothetical protein KUI_0143 [Taylorella equigenitalis ATCC 35865]